MLALCVSFSISTASCSFSDESFVAASEAITNEKQNSTQLDRSIVAPATSDQASSNQITLAQAGTLNSKTEPVDLTIATGASKSSEPVVATTAPSTGAPTLSASPALLPSPPTVVPLSQKAAPTGPTPGGGPTIAPVIVSPTTGSPPVDAPVRLVLEDHSTGRAVDVQPAMELKNFMRNDSFADSALSEDCTGWTEYSTMPTVALPVLGGIRFGAKLIKINAGGIYAQPSYAVVVMQHAIDLRAGLFGDPRGKRTYAPAHKIRIETADGRLLKTIQMNDGGAINHADYMQIPALTIGGVLTDLRGVDGIVKPWVPVGGSYVEFFGEINFSSPKNLALIPRNKPEWISAGPKKRSATNGDEFQYFSASSDNSNGHPYGMPLKAKSLAESRRLMPDAFNPGSATGDPELVTGNDFGDSWHMSQIMGIEFEPGAYGGLPRRNGPGGIRGNARSIVPGEFLQMFLAEPTGRRPHDGTPHKDLAWHLLRNYANYPTYRPIDLRDLKPFNLTSTTLPAPILPLGAGKVGIKQNYYGDLPSNGSTDPNYQNNLFWHGDTYGSGYPAAIYEGLYGNKPHPWAGWSPEGQHNFRLDAGYGALIFAHPVFAQMHEHITTEALSTTQVISGNRGFDASDNMQNISEPLGRWTDRGNIGELANLTMAWKVASRSGVYTRPSIEGALRTFLLKEYDLVLSKIPQTPTTAGQAGFKNLGGVVRWISWDQRPHNDQGSGWAVYWNLGSAYMAQTLALMRAVGLETALRTGGNSSENQRVSVVLDALQNMMGAAGKMFLDYPWAVRQGKDDQTYLILRQASQGASQTDINSIPKNWSEVNQYNLTNPRNDQWWFLTPYVVVPNTGTPPDGPVNFMTASFSGRMGLQTASLYYDYFAPLGADRTSHRDLLATRIATLRSYGSKASDARQRASAPTTGLFRYMWPQSVPILNN